MKKVRLVLGIAILLVSLGVLIWALVPLEHVTRVVPVPPSDLQLPTPEALSPFVEAFL